MIEEEKLINKINILFLTHIEQTKGIYETVDAYHILRLCPQVMLTIAGDGSETARVRSYVKANGTSDVRFLICHRRGKAPCLLGRRYITSFKL